MPTRWLTGLGRWLLLAAFLALAPAQAGEAELRQFAETLGLANVDGFVATVTILRERGRLPPHYLTRAQAERLGWRRGADLCAVVPGRSFGGDHFGNYERRLPDARGRRWREADLDFACGQRGTRRLVWSSDGHIFVTVDHYNSFLPVPP